MRCFRSSATHLSFDTRTLSFRQFSIIRSIKSNFFNRFCYPARASVACSPPITNRHKPRVTSSISTNATFSSRNGDHPDLAWNVNHESFGLFTSPQISRIASRAVRMAIERHQPRDAFTIIQSLSHSIASYTSHASSIDPPRKPAIDFGIPVSPRLASHCLLHGLLRLGFYRQADAAAKQMFQLGIPVHSKSLEAVIHGLGHKTSPIFNRSTVDDSLRKFLPPTTLLEASRLVRNENLAKALELVDHARQYNRQRTRRMFLSLVDACLLQGEIIVAAFLFSFLVKQYFLRNQAPVLAETDTASCSDTTSPINPSRSGQMKWRPKFKDPYPEHLIMNKILAHSEAEIFTQRTTSWEVIKSISDAAQAITELTTLLDERLIPFSHLSSLIRVLYTFPRDPSIKVLVLKQDGTYDVVVGHVYFNEVLSRLITRLPIAKPDILQQDKLPPLDRRSYNSLLHHALRHKLSPKLASKILDHMTKLRQPPLKPDTTTLNILLREGTLVRRDDIVMQALSGLRQRDIGEADRSNLGEEKSGEMVRGAQSNNDRWTPNRDTVAVVDDPITFEQPIPCQEKVHDMMERVTAEDFDFRLDSQQLTRLQADGYTLTSYIAYLVARGQTDAVADLLYELIPELSGSENSLSSNGKSSDIDNQARAKLLRAVKYGPRFFIAVLQALKKAGRTGLAERIWVLAKQAEAASWDESFAGQHAAWCLPIHAYTIMMQIYSAERKRGLNMRVVQRRGNELRITLHKDSQISNKDYALGWAGEIHGQRRNGDFNLTRSEVARSRASSLYRSMHWDAAQIYDSLMTLRSNPDQVGLDFRKVDIPEPDARFFNAALSLFGRQIGMFKRNVTTSPSRWHRKLRSMRRLYDKYGTLPSAADPKLIEILQAMHQYGYPIPIAYRRFLVGVWLPQPSDANIKLTGERLPFPRETKNLTTPYYLVIRKTRGLPVRRRYGRQTTVVHAVN